MRKLDQRGSMALLVSLIIFIVLFIGAAGFGLWAYSGRQDFKNNTQTKINAAVAVAEKNTASAKDDQFAQAEKNPLKTYTGPPAYGAPSVSYPKTWSAYVNETGSSTNIDGFFHPNFVPYATQTQSFALRLQVVSQAYSQVLNQFSSQVQNGTAKVSVYAAPKVPNVAGSRIDGAIAPQKQGSMVLIPLRDKTLEVWTEADQFIPDFNNIILPNLTFNP